MVFFIRLQPGVQLGRGRRCAQIASHLLRFLCRGDCLLRMIGFGVRYRQVGLGADVLGIDPERTVERVDGVLCAFAVQ